MKIKFSLKGSRIYDFFQFLTNKKNILERRRENQGYDDICYGLFLNLIKKTEQYSKRFEEFYYPECFLFGDFIPYFNYIDWKDEAEFLNAMTNLDGEQIQKMILSSLLYKLQGIAIENEKDLEPYIEDVQEKGMITFLDSLSMENAGKWEILQAWEKPEKKRNRYVELMREILPIFLQEYSVYEKEIKSYGLNLQKRMQRDGLSVLTNMWEGIYAQWNNVEESLLQSNFLFVSGVLPLISTGFEQGAKNKRFYLQGIYLERGLEKLRKIRFDNREEMVFFFKNLGDETRFKVLELISQGIGTNKEIAEKMEITTATVSYHLNYLYNANMILRTEENGRKKIIIHRRGIEEKLDKFKEKILITDKQ